MNHAVCIRSTVTNIYAAVIALVMFAEMMPTVKWKVVSFTKEKILLEQGNLLRIVYYFAVFVFSAVNIFKAVMFFLLVLSQDLGGSLIDYFLSEPSRNNIKSARREGAFTLVSESFLILITVSCIQLYRPIIISAKDGIFYRSQMVIKINSRNFG